MRVWRIPLSTNVERVALALGHKRVTVDWVDVEPDDRSAVVALSGQRRVPVLEDDDGRVVVDSTVILEHLERHFPEPRLYPADPLGAQVGLFVEWFERAWKPVAGSIEAELVDHAPNPDQAVIAKLEGRLVGALDLLEGLLRGGDFLLGGQFTAADCVAFPFIKYAALGMPPGDDKLFHRILVDHQPVGDSHPLLIAWIKRVDGLPRA